jgi:hypothetical protein
VTIGGTGWLVNSNLVETDIVTKTHHTETETAHTRHVYTNIKQKDNNQNNEEKVNIGHR